MKLQGLIPLFLFRYAGKFLSPTAVLAAVGSRARPYCSSLEDQQLASLIMWIPGGVIMASTPIVLFGLWLKESDRRMFARERLALARSVAVMDRHEGEDESTAILDRIIADCRWRVVRQGGMDQTNPGFCVGYFSLSGG